MKTTTEMAREANLPACHTSHSKALARFAELARADEREACAEDACDAIAFNGGSVQMESNVRQTILARGNP